MTGIRLFGSGEPYKFDVKLEVWKSFPLSKNKVFVSKTRQMMLQEETQFYADGIDVTFPLMFRVSDL